MNSELSVNIHTVTIIVNADPVLSRNAEGVMQCVFYGDSHYWTRGEEQTNRYRVVTFGQGADIAQRFCRDGSQVLISGPSRIRDEPSGPVVTEFVAPQLLKVLPEEGQ